MPVIASHAANAQFHAENGAAQVEGPTPYADRIKAIAEVTETWIGGTATLTDTDFTFQANGLNDAILGGEGVMTLTLPVSAIMAVRERATFITGTIDIVTIDRALFSIRCWGAKAFGDQIMAAAGIGAG